jgi:hypothetical protein
MDQQQLETIKQIGSMLSDVTFLGFMLYLWFTERQERQAVQQKLDDTLRSQTK